MTSVGIDSVRSIREASYGLNSGTGRWRYPRFFLCGSKSNGILTLWLWVSAMTDIGFMIEPINAPAIQEEEIKNRLRDDFFKEYDATLIIGRIDFAVTLRTDGNDLFDKEYFLWAEAKRSPKEDLLDSFIQLIITIGKAKTHEKLLPPHFLGAFDSEKIAFIEFHHIIGVLYQGDINWNVTPSDHKTDTFLHLRGLLHDKISQEMSVFSITKDDKALRKFISRNFRMGKERTSRISITRNNFMFVFQRWVEEVKPSIAVEWTDVPNTSVVDFFYADLISRDDYTRSEELAVVLRGDRYKILQQILKSGTLLFSEASFNDKKAAYRQFLNKYERPPRKDYLEVILERRDLLIPQNLRQYQGAFFTPPQWVQKSQEYLADVLGENWQQEYYVWDCCAGTGNLLYGLTEKYRVWASDLSSGFVQVMKERIKEQSLNLKESHVFTFDFLNDPFKNLPPSLQDVIGDPEKQKKLVIYINPPYGEAGESKQRSGTGKNKTGISNTTQIHKDYAASCGKYAKRELFVQFLMRIYKEIPSCTIAEFSKTKILQSPYFKDFRSSFLAKLKKGFLIPAYTFDNVTGKFPVNFLIWDLKEKQKFEQAKLDVYTNADDEKGEKTIISYDNSLFINDWFRPKWKGVEIDDSDIIGYLACNGNDFQNQNYINIDSVPRNQTSTYLKPVTLYNLKESCIYFAVRTCIDATWLNDRDQYLFPNKHWKYDTLFQSDCLVYALFNNNIQSQYGPNHWIPFLEDEVDARDNYACHFMTDYISGRLRPKAKTPEVEGELFELVVDTTEYDDSPLTFSSEAKAVLEAGKELWRYYHQQPDSNPNASYYDIRLHFQGYKTSKGGKKQMNTESEDEKYIELLANLRAKVKELSSKIAPKVYEYGFLV